MSKIVFLEHLCDHIQENRVHHLRTVVTKDFIGGFIHMVSTFSMHCGYLAHSESGAAIFFFFQTR